MFTALLTPVRMNVVNSTYRMRKRRRRRSTYLKNGSVVDAPGRFGESGMQPEIRAEREADRHLADQLVALDEPFVLLAEALLLAA